MSQPIYLNDKSYPIQVGTPSGTGRMINPGFAVEGNYFDGPVSRGMPLRRLKTSEAETFDKQKILLRLTTTSAGVQEEAVKPYSAPEPPEEDIEETPVELASTTKLAPNQNKTMEQTLNQAMKEMGTQIPTLAELKKMNMQELNAVAVKYGISQANGRSDIIKQLVAKLSL